MSGIKLELNKDSIIINKINNMYEINSVKQWIFLTKFTKAYLVISIPGDHVIETTIDSKFVYNQDYKLTQDLDFNYRYIAPLCNIIPFTGTFDGCNYSMMNLNITVEKQSFSTGSNDAALFGLIKSGVIKNLTIVNSNINSINSAVLISKGYNVELSNIKIIGNMYITGQNCACLANILEGSCKDIFICIDGEIIAGNKNAVLISNEFNGSIENCNVISNISNGLGYFNIINGRLSNSNLISFTSVGFPFYITTKYHQIYNCYYFQLNNMDLPLIQRLSNCYYKNLDTTIFSNEPFNWSGIIVNNNYYLKNIINYSIENISNRNVKNYNYLLDNANFSDYYINKMHEFNYIILPKYNRNTILENCKKMESIYHKENLAMINYKENIIKINANRVTELVSKIQKNVLFKYNIIDNNEILFIDDENNIDIPIIPEPVVEHIIPEVIAEQVVEHIIPEPMVAPIIPEVIVEPMVAPIILEVIAENVVAHSIPEVIAEPMVAYSIPEVIAEPMVAHIIPEVIAEHVVKPIPEVIAENVVEHIIPEVIAEHVVKPIPEVIAEPMVAHSIPEVIVAHIIPEVIVAHIIPEVIAEPMVAHIISEVIVAPSIPEVIAEPMVAHSIQEVIAEHVVVSIIPKVIAENVVKPIPEVIAEPIILNTKSKNKK